MKYLLPWKCRSDSLYPLFGRRVIGSSYEFHVRLWESVSGWSYSIDAIYTLTAIKSQEEIMGIVDRELESRGYYLVQEDEVERFMRLEVLM